MTSIIAWVVVTAKMMFEIFVMVEICICLNKVIKGVREDRNTVVVYSILGIFMAVLYLMMK